MTKATIVSMNIPLSWFVYSPGTRIVDIPSADISDYHNSAIERGYKSGFLRKGDRVSIKNNKTSFTITRYRK